jgi:peptidoglycan/xylan/chitin deacetylase (PgdA/CDA1 family)
MDPEEIEKLRTRERENSGCTRASSRVFDFSTSRFLWQIAVVALGLAVAAGAGPRAVAEHGPAAMRHIAITFDDLPGVSQRSTVASLDEINARLLATLRIERVPVVGFVNERSVDVKGERDARTAILKRWLDARMELGNHTYSHPDLNSMSADEYQVDILQGELVTRKLLTERGQRLRWFRHPFTHTGPTAEIKAQIDGFLGAHGYTVAPFTIEAADYAFAAVYERATLHTDETSDKVMAAYLTMTDERMAFYESLATDTFGREIPQVLLVHVNRLNADAMPELLRRLKARGYSWISLSDTLKDEAYNTRDGYVGPSGPSWLHRWRVTLGKPDRFRDEPDPPEWVMRAFNP